MMLQGDDDRFGTTSRWPQPNMNIVNFRFQDQLSKTTSHHLTHPPLRYSVFVPRTATARNVLRRSARLKNFPANASARICLSNVKSATTRFNRLFSTSNSLSIRMICSGLSLALAIPASCCPNLPLYANFQTGTVFRAKTPIPIASGCGTRAL